MKIGEILSDLEYNYDYILKYSMKFLSNCKDKNTQTLLKFYSRIIKCLCSMLEKGIRSEKINFIFRPAADPVDFKSRITKYVAICKYIPNDTLENIINSVEYLSVKDPKRKKPLRLPEFDLETKTSKNFAKTQDHNVLIYNKFRFIYYKIKVFINLC